MSKKNKFINFFVNYILLYFFNPSPSANYKYFKLYLSGGEPTHWAALIPVVEKFREIAEWPGSCVGINTNFSRPTSWWEEHHHLFEDVVASYHAEWSKDDKYIANYKFLQDKKNYLCSKIYSYFF